MRQELQKDLFANISIFSDISKKAKYLTDNRELLEFITSQFVDTSEIIFNFEDSNDVLVSKPHPLEKEFLSQYPMKYPNYGYHPFYFELIWKGQLSNNLYASLAKGIKQKIYEENKLAQNRERSFLTNRNLSNKEFEDRLNYFKEDIENGNSSFRHLVDCSLFLIDLLNITGSFDIFNSMDDITAFIEPKISLCLNNTEISYNDGISTTLIRNRMQDKSKRPSNYMLL